MYLFAIEKARWLTKAVAKTSGSGCSCGNVSIIDTARGYFLLNMAHSRKPRQDTNCQPYSPDGAPCSERLSQQIHERCKGVQYEVVCTQKWGPVMYVALQNYRRALIIFTRLPPSRRRINCQSRINFNEDSGAARGRTHTI